ncbi:MAG: serine acetyltransferase [Thermodesulfobacteriota bacterium]
MTLDQDHDNVSEGGPCREVRSQAIEFRHRLPEVVDRLVDTCYSGQCFEHVGAEPLPSRANVVALVEATRDILFPGYFGTQGVDAVNLRYRLGLEISSLFDRLSVEITNAIRHDCIRCHLPCQECSEQGKEKAYAFLQRLPDLRASLATDVRATYEGDPAAKGVDEIIFCYPGVFAITVYRIAHALHELSVPLLPRIMTEYAHSVTGVDIHPGAEIGHSFFIDHGTGVVVGETTVIGNRVKIYQGVTLGALAFKRDASGALERGRKRHPTLEDDVTVYAGTTILGGETVIGAGSVIGGNVWLTRSVPPGTKVLLNPPELILKSRGA